MKITALVFLVSSSVPFAKDAALPSFSDKLLDHPELSLSEAVKTGQLPPFDPEAKAQAEMLRHASTGQKRFVSRMPVVEPREVDRNMPVVAPRADIDLKIIVKEPEVESAK